MRIETESGKPVVARMDANLINRIENISNSLSLSRSATLRLLVNLGLKQFNTY